MGLTGARAEGSAAALLELQPISVNLKPQAAGKDRLRPVITSPDGASIAQFATWCRLPLTYCECRSLPRISTRGHGQDLGLLSNRPSTLSALSVIPMQQAA